jgi:hypothetical protein
MLWYRLLLWRINRLVHRLLFGGPGPEGVPPVGVREPHHRRPGGRGAAIALNEPDDRN